MIDNIVMPAIVAACLIFCTMNARAQGDVKAYSYFCLEVDQTLCLGISPGDTDPVYDPSSIFYLQVKSRTRTEFTNTDYKKTRWDADYANNKVVLSRFPNLCMAKEGGYGLVGLFPCDQTQNWPSFDQNVRYGLWDLSLFSGNIDKSGTLELVGDTNSMCLTAMQCKLKTPPDGLPYCDSTSTDVAWDTTLNQPTGLRAGSYLRMRPCYDSVGGNPQWKGVQVWRQKLDCAVGCSPFLQFNNVCDPVCNNDECDYDNGVCRTRSPTPPTRSPTPPRTGFPTGIPTSNAPSQSPSTSTPSATPTRSPTAAPSGAPTKKPSRGPTMNPSKSPAISCPAPGELDFCARFVQQGCINNPLARERCIWCQDKCNPRGDPRVCIYPDIYAACPALCPTNPQRLTCPKAITKKKCLKNTWMRKNCQWCGPKMACLPGKDTRQCLGDPSIYDHCGTIAPTGSPCLPKATFYTCYSAKNPKKCLKKSCTWCPSDKLNPCKPMKKTPALDPCTIGTFNTARDLIMQYFRQCPLLNPTTKPTRIPTVISQAPSRTPTTSFPTKSPTRSPSSLPSHVPSTISPSQEPTTASPSFSPSKATTRAPTSPTTMTPTGSPTSSKPSRSPSNTPTRSVTFKPTTSAPTKRPTTLKPTSRAPTKRPTVVSPSRAPTRRKMSPTKRPSAARIVTGRPTAKIPTTRPTTGKPSAATHSPSTSSPSASPSKSPATTRPSASPSVSRPTSSPSTSAPSQQPTSSKPSKTPTNSPVTAKPSQNPMTSQPTHGPTTTKPTISPSAKPSQNPMTSQPTHGPTTTKPTISPSAKPSKNPTTTNPSNTPSSAPVTSKPSTSPVASEEHQNNAEYEVRDPRMLRRV